LSNRTYSICVSYIFAINTNIYAINCIYFSKCSHILTSCRYSSHPWLGTLPDIIVRMFFRYSHRLALDVSLQVT
jgi:hypothetical protein